MNPFNFSSPANETSSFLEPPHHHDPAQISHIAALPASMLAQLPQTVQDALWTLQESTSVVYASYLRLQALLDARFERLTPLPGVAGTYSETSFFNYTNALAAERSYLLEDAHPDWKHKARQAGLLSQSSPATSPVPVDIAGFYFSQRATASPSLSQWMEQLCEAEALWIQSARSAVMPDFESTVLEFQNLRESESVISPTPSELSFSSEDDDLWSGNSGGNNNTPVSSIRKVPGHAHAVKRQFGAAGVVGHHISSAAHGLGPERIARALEAFS